MKIVIATIKEWNLRNAAKFISEYPIHNVVIIKDHRELTYEVLSSLQPDYVFFPHWSWIIPEKIYKRFRCIVFHMTDLPFGRGGSPLQNLIINKIQNTKISAIEVVKELDAGSVYLKSDLFIGKGSATEIFEKMAEIIFFNMIPMIVSGICSPVKQNGEIVTFKRRKPIESNLINAQHNTPSDIYDFIRMLDAEGYPKAFIELNQFIIRFSRVENNEDILSGNFTIEYKDEYKGK